MSKQRAQLRRVSLFACAALLVGALVPTVASAAFVFTGGPDEGQYPTYVLNDHTPFAVHYSAVASSGLEPNASYYVKVRFTPGTTPGGNNNRAYTWNPTTQEWLQERFDVRKWTAFPVVTTDASGAISPTSPDSWLFAKFGDELKAGQYHLMISMSSTLSTGGATANSSIVPTVTVLDSRTSGGWIHNGVAYSEPATRACVTNDASTTVLGLGWTEAQGVDDDSNGVVDDEDWGPAGAAGDFRVGVPAATPLGITLAGAATWAPAIGFVSGPADVDLAIGASDSIAPSAPALLTSKSGDATASLNWTSATDNNAVAGYYVYRWSPAPLGVEYSSVHARVATLGLDATSFHDSGLINGTTYLYEVRAFDSATNVGPRSATATVTTAMTPQAYFLPADGSNGWYVTAPLVELAVGQGRTGLYSFAASPSTWITYTAPFRVDQGVRTLTFRDTDGVTMSAPQTRQFKVDFTRPTAALSAPALTVHASSGRSFTVSWAGADAVSGPASFDVDYRTSTTAPWTRWRRSVTTRSAVFAGTAGSNVYFRVLVRDRAGNSSAYSPTKQTVIPYDQKKARYSSSWKTAKGSGYFLGSSRYSTKKGASATLSFTKGTLYLVAKTSPKLGKIGVYYRGHKVATVNLHSSKTKYRQVFKILSRSTGTKAYTVKLVNLGTKHHSRVEVDGIALKR